MHARFKKGMAVLMVLLMTFMVLPSIVFAADTDDLTFILTTPAADASNTISVDQGSRSVSINVANNTSSVTITAAKTINQTISIAGPDAGAVTTGGTATAPTFSINTTSVSAIGGTETITLQVDEAGKTSINYKVQVSVAKPPYNATLSINFNSVALTSSSISYTVDSGASQNTSTSAIGQVQVNVATGFHRIAVTYNAQTLENSVTDSTPSAIYNFTSGGGIGTCYTVVYKDWDGNFLKAVGVPGGQAAAYGSNPTRSGYTFANWVLDSDTSNDATDELSDVVSDLTVRAKYSSATAGSYTLSRGLIYSNGGLWFNVSVTRGTAAQLNNPLVKVTYTTGSGQVIAVIPITVDASGNSSGNRVFIPNGATNVSARLVDGDDANWPTAYKSAAVTVTSTQINAGAGN